MNKNNKMTYLDKFKRGLATTMIVASMAGVITPIAQVSAARVDYDNNDSNGYVTENTETYKVQVNPMLGSNASGNVITPKGGKYKIQQVARFDVKGERHEVKGAKEETLTLDDKNSNFFTVKDDGEYKITPVERIPGYYTDTGAVTKEDNKGKQEKVDAQGHYLYAFPLIKNGVAQEGQTIDFMPKLKDVRETLTIDKIGDDQKTKLKGVEFTVYQRFDERTQKSFKDGAETRGTVTTDANGRAVFENLPEGEYYFVEGKNVSNKYLPDSRKVDFNVEVNSEGTESFITATNNNNSVSTEGKNKRGEYKDKSGTITRFNYLDPSEAKGRTYFQIKSDYTRHGDSSEEGVNTKGQATGNSQGVVYVNTNGELDFASHVDIPKNINDYENFKIVDTVDDKVTIKEDTLELRVIGKDGAKETYKDEELKGLVSVVGQKITLDGKAGELQDILEREDVHQYLLTYKASINTTEIKEGVEYDVLNFSQTITSDKSMTDGTNTSKTTTHPVTVSVQEGQIVVDKVENDGKEGKLEGAEFQLYEKDDNGDFEHDGQKWSKASNPRTKVNYFGTTDENGELKFSNLPYGTYLLVETKAPEGYRLNKNHEVIEVDMKNQDNVGGTNTKTHTIKNMRRSQIFPGTGTMGNIVTLMVLATAGGTFIYVTAKKKEEEEEGQSDAQ